MAKVDISAWAKKTGVTLDQATRAIQVELFSGVIRDTRVDTGRMRGNWQASTMTPIRTEIEREDKSGSATITDMISEVGVGTITYLTNNLPYVGIYEQKDGMVAKNMARIETIVRKETR